MWGYTLYELSSIYLTTGPLQIEKIEARQLQGVANPSDQTNLFNLEIFSHRNSMAILN